MLFYRIGMTASVVAFLSVFCFGQDSSTIKIVPHGFASMEWGQVVSGYDKNVGDIAHVAFDRIFFGVGLDVLLSDNTNFKGRLDVKTFNEFPRLLNPGGTRRFYHYLYLHQAELRHQLINENGLKVAVGGGYFPFKYNADARNLGEYLFRSTAYPQTITTEFDIPWVRLAGIYTQGSYTMGVHRVDLDLIANLNTEWMAIGDLNLTAIASYNFAKLVEVGAGVQFGSLVSADESATTPKDIQTRYISGNDTTQYYTFRGTKVMGRVSFDPKKLFTSDLFGCEDLKLYSEASLIGVKNYGVALHSPVWYNSILERIPVMGGFNVPTFKILDVLSIEGEWWGNRYPNSMEGIVIEGLPLPFLGSRKEVDSLAYVNDNVKWSVFAAKTFWKHYRVAAQAASDHMRTFAWDYQRQDWEESLHGPSKWSFALKFGVLF